ncbi:amino acid deaminase [Caulobacter sp. KR2-114]|uniref:amino acid deaminase n=1 Tax=Caulobacter sp. KR2-114 TaxID=3400912 RepID=UPI003C03AC8D
MTFFLSQPAGAAIAPWEKGAPGSGATVALGDVGAQGWNVLAEDLPLPAAILKDSALRHNSRWMRAFLAGSGVQIAPHGKTTMSPELFRLQIEDGAWGITLSTPHQVRVARAFGHSRIFLANQLIGRAGIAYIVAELKRDPGFEFYCLVDSVQNVDQIAAAAAAADLGRPVRVLVELGFDGGRTGCRSLEEALVVARAVRATSGLVALAGVEGFEGIIRGPSVEETLARVTTFLDEMAALAYRCEAERLFAPGTVVFSAGGSAFFDLVAAKLGAIRLAQESMVLLRSGCYLTHDSVMYTKLFALLAQRDQALASSHGGLVPALEVWAYVQSVPEPGRVIVALGKRDVSYDDPPVALAWFRPGAGMAGPEPAPQDHRVTQLNDQHAYLSTPPDTPWRVGDMVGFGISHPCLTFDKWRVLHVVDDAYGVTGAVRTYF